jgi:hypothetical protein
MTDPETDQTLPDVIEDRATDADVPALFASLAVVESVIPRLTAVLRLWLSASPALRASLRDCESARPADVALDVACDVCELDAAVYVQPWPISVSTFGGLTVTCPLASTVVVLPS